MKFVTVNTAELIGPVLRFAMAAACGWRLERIEETDCKEGPHWWRAIDSRQASQTSLGLVGYIKPGAKGVTGLYDYCPDVDWEIGGPLISHFKVEFEQVSPTTWRAETRTEHSGLGPTHLIAACRAIVASKLGDTVQVPEELAP